MKKLFLAVTVLASSITVAQKPVISFTSDFSMYVILSGETGAKFYNEIETINDFAISDFDSAFLKLGGDANILSWNFNENKMDIFIDSIKCFVPSLDTTVVGWNVKHYGSENGVFRFESTKKLISENKTYIVTFYQILDKKAIGKDEIAYIEFYKCQGKSIFLRVVYGDRISDFRI